MGDQDFPLERSWYIGNAFFAILYGIQISMYFQSVYYLNAGRGGHRSKMFYIGYSTVLLVLITFALACNLFFGQAMWIEHRDVDGGPVAFFGENIAAWYNTLGTAADVTANVLGDGLMLYRCYVFWGHVPWAMVFPSLVYLGSVAMGITTTIQSGLPGNFLEFLSLIKRPLCFELTVFQVAIFSQGSPSILVSHGLFLPLSSIYWSPQ